VPVPTAAQTGQLAVALLATWLLARECRLRRSSRSGARAASGRALPVLVVLGAAAYVNFGALHQGRFVHIWDTYHHYIGAKYFPELGYDALYQCTAVADAEAGLRPEVARRTMTDLRTNERAHTLDVLLHPEICKRRFTAARWAEFVHDVAWFRERVTPTTWGRMQRDHGYNATPVWNAVGHVLTRIAPASELQIACLVLLDPLLLAAALLLLLRCFGWRVCAVAAVVLGTFYPGQFSWTGGAFLRFDWLFCAVAGLCALRTGRPALGGAAFATAALLRLFPAAMLVGPALAAMVQLVRRRRCDRAHLHLLAGAAVAGAVALPPALIISGERSSGFVDNTVKHAGATFTNHMGLPTLLAYRPDSTVRRLREGGTRDLWPRFREARRDALRQTRPVILAAGLALLVLLGVAGQRLAPWRTAALSLLLLPALLELTCYYYAFAAALAVLAERRPAAGLALCGTCAASMLVALGLFPRVGLDEGYIALSVVTILGLAATAVLALRKRTAPDADDAECADEPDRVLRTRLSRAAGAGSTGERGSSGEGAPAEPKASASPSWGQSAGPSSVGPENRRQASP